MIDDHFIETWHPKYDEVEDDEFEYEKLIAQAKWEIDRPFNQTLDKATFNRIIDWKSSRVKGIIKNNDFQIYASAISELSVHDDLLPKIEHLIKLPGFGAPVSSTLLHFLYPHKFPIIDKRTVDVLRHYDLVQQKSTGVAQYLAFAKAIFDIQQRCKKRWSLRQIDRALFMYHKLQPEIFGQLNRQPVNPRRIIMESMHMPRKVKRLTNHDKIQIAVCLKRGEILSTADIRQLVLEAYPNFNEGSLLPNDHGNGNAGQCPCAGTPRQIFKKTEKGMYLVL